MARLPRLNLPDIPQHVIQEVTIDNLAFSQIKITLFILAS
jgi:hypothetical protein